VTQECNFTEPELRLWRVLRSSDAGPCIDLPPRAARKVAENLREPFEGFSMRAWPRSNGRREKAERERDDLRRELYALKEPRESPETVGEVPERARTRPDASRAQGGRTEALVA
jgi:hypothetical protein